MEQNGRPPSVEPRIETDFFIKHYNYNEQAHTDIYLPAHAVKDLALIHERMNRVTKAESFRIAVKLLRRKHFKQDLALNHATTSVLAHVTQILGEDIWEKNYSFAELPKDEDTVD